MTFNTLLRFGKTLLLLAILNTYRADSATVENVTLLGDTNYINSRGNKDYVLECSYRAGYDDPVSSVTWYRDRQLVYSWKLGDSFSAAYGLLNGYVFTTGKPKLQNLNFINNLVFALSGNYTCQVDSRLGQARSNPYPLVILDVPSENFQTNVTLLNEASSGNQNQPTNCTLLWDFKTPAIYPRPNVTCGYYSYLHDDVTYSMPAGLTMQLLSNGSWQASLDHTQVQVSEIPRERRLGCSVRVPDTSYKKVIKFEDHFIIDHLIDSEGCQSTFLDPEYKLRFKLDLGGAINCRGEIVPKQSDGPVKVTLSCRQGELALFLNGDSVSNWSDQIICDPSSKQWLQMSNGKTLQTRNISEFLPVCRDLRNSGMSLRLSRFMAVSLILLLHFL